MSFIPQDDTGLVANANAMITVQYFLDYFADRGIDVSEYDNPSIEGGIVSATEYVGVRFNYKGEPIAEGTPFPRECLTNRYGETISGIPKRVKDATAQYTRQALLGGGELAPAPEVAANGQRVTMTKDKVGPIEEERQYAEGASLTIFKPYPIADALLSEYVLKTASIQTIRV